MLLARSRKLRTNRNAALPMALETTVENRRHRTWVPAFAGMTERIEWPGGGMGNSLMILHAPRGGG